MSLTEEEAAPDQARSILRQALNDGAKLSDDAFAPSFDDTLDVERDLLAAAATLIARRAEGSLDRSARMVEEAKRSLVMLTDVAVHRDREARRRRAYMSRRP